MTDEEIALWVERARAASHAQMPWWVREFRREFARVADEFEAGVADEIAHRARVETILASGYRTTGERFARLGAAMIKFQQREEGIGNRASQTYLERVARLIRVHGALRAGAVSRRTWGVIRRTLAQAAGEGVGEREAGKRVREALAGRMSVKRARMIARTEIGAAQNAGMLDAAEALQVRYKKRWVAIEDGRTRATHTAVDGKTIPRGEKFRVGGAELDHPGDPTGPAKEIINCFPGDTEVIALGAIRKVFRRAYEGPLVRIKTESGEVIRGTPNHPVLTPYGWVALGELRCGDNLVCHRVEVRRRFSEHEPERQPLTLAEAFELGNQAGASRNASGSWVDFNGDGRPGEVNIVTLDGELRGEAEPSCAQGDTQLALAKTDVRLAGLPCSGALLHFIRAAHAASDGIVRGGGARRSVRRAHSAHAEPVGFAGATYNDPGGHQSAVNCRAADSVPMRECIDALAAQVIRLDSVASILVENGTHEVFTLETDTNAYLAGAVVARNCRCTMLLELA